MAAKEVKPIVDRSLFTRDLRVLYSSLFDSGFTRQSKFNQWWNNTKRVGEIKARPGIDFIAEKIIGYDPKGKRRARLLCTEEYYAKALEWLATPPEGRKAIVQQRESRRKAVLKWERVNSAGEQECFCCKTIKPLSGFHRQKAHEDRAYAGVTMYAGVCISCRRKKYKKSKQTVGQAMQQLLSSSQKRGKKSIGNDLTKEFLVELWEKQSGICAYTQKEMSLEVNSRDKVSLDRVDPALGYSQNNVVLVRSSINLLKADIGLREWIELCREVSANA